MTETLQHQKPFVIDSPEVLLQQSMYMIISQVALWEAIEKAMAKREEDNPVPESGVKSDIILPTTPPR